MRIVVALIFAFALALQAQEPAARRLPEHEELRYAVQWSKLAVVDATFTLAPGPSSPVITVLAETRALASRVYRVENRYATDIDTATGYVSTYRKEIDEAKFQEQRIALYDQTGRVADVQLDGVVGRVELPGATHNLFSALYAVRQHDFGEQPELPFYLDAKGAFWRATARRARNLRVKGALVWEVHVDFRLVDEDAELRQSDLLTDYIVRGDEPLKLFIRQSDPPLVTSMEYVAKGFHIVAELQED